MENLTPSRRLFLALLAAPKSKWDLPPEEWSEKHVRALLDDSPWTRPALLNLSTPSPARNAPEPTVERFRVRWASAAAVREAFARCPRCQANEPPPATESYTIQVIGSPNAAARHHPKASDEMLAKAVSWTTLRRPGSDPIHPSSLEFGTTGPLHLSARFVFPTPLSLDDTPLEFATLAAPRPIRVTFRPPEMKFAGRLDL